MIRYPVSVVFPNPGYMRDVYEVRVRDDRVQPNKALPNPWDAQIVKRWPMPAESQLGGIFELARRDGTYTHDCTSCTYIEFPSVDDAAAFMDKVREMRVTGRLPSPRAATPDAKGPGVDWKDFAGGGSE